MKSPFPGLDPYVEPFWSGFHTRLMVKICDQLQNQLPEGLWADVEETVVVEAGGHDRTYFKPDAAVFDSRPWDPSPDQSSLNVVLTEPLIVEDNAEQTEREILILDTTTGDKVVTVLELLSPVNKLGTANRLRYLEKRRSYRSSGANIVEVDLIRSGEHIVGVPENRIPSDKRKDGIVSVYRWVASKWEVYPISLRDSLPNFRVPLRPGDRDVVVQLQLGFDEVFEIGGYGRRIDYSKDPEPRLTREDAEWAGQLLRGIRGARLGTKS